MNKKTIKFLQLGIIAFSSTTLVVSGVSFAWINYNKNVDIINIITSGSLSIDSSSIELYRFEFPYINGTTLIDYNSKDGAVHDPYQLTTTTAQYMMNMFDPAYLTINPDKSVSDLNTNVVLKISLNYRSSINYKLTMKATKKASWITDDDTKRTLRASDFMDFLSISSSAYDTAVVDTTYTADKDKVFYTNKKLFEGVSSNRVNFFSNSVSEINLYEIPSITAIGEDQIQNITFYLSIDYNQAACINYFQALELTNPYTLDMDYNFTIVAEQI